MKLKDIGLFQVVINEENILDAIEVRRMMESPGWKILDNWMEGAREYVLEEGKQHAINDSEITTKLRWAILEGFDRARALPLQIKVQVENFKSTINQGDESNGNEQE